jgi:mono/diheme cytochrome c family protein
MPTRHRSIDRGIAVAATALAVLLLVGASVASAQKPPQPFAPDWAMLAGQSVFAQKGCGQCHSIRGFGGKVGPDLGRIQTGKSFFEIGAAMWNHLPNMGARMREAGIERATLTPEELSNLVAFIFTAQYQDEVGDPKSGEKLFTAKNCVRCHAVGGAGGRVGPELDRLRRSNSPVLVAAAMWNHGPQMAAAMAANGIQRPTFGRNELVDLIAYIVSASSDTASDTEQVIPGTPDRGRQFFTDKQCVTCHAVGGKGGRVGPDLGRPGHHISLTQFATQMWNHAPAMTAKMKERGIDPPKLSGQDMADILAYLYVSRYFDEASNASRGQQLVRSKNCLTCHSVRGVGGKISADFASSTVVRTPASLVAGMWNHSRLMERQTEKQQVAWPVLSGQDLGDIAAYLGSLGAPARKGPTK